jgi:hypothetical protein
METGELTLKEAKTHMGSKNKLAEIVNNLEIIPTHFAVGYYLLVNKKSYMSYMSIYSTTQYCNQTYQKACSPWLRQCSSVGSIASQCASS